MHETREMPVRALRREDPSVGKLPGGGSGNPLQYSCRENPMDRGAWWGTVYGVTESHTRPSDSHFLFTCPFTKITYILSLPCVSETVSQSCLRCCCSLPQLKLHSQLSHCVFKVDSLKIKLQGLQENLDRPPEDQKRENRHSPMLKVGSAA